MTAGSASAATNQAGSQQHATNTRHLQQHGPSKSSSLQATAVSAGTNHNNNIQQQPQYSLQSAPFSPSAAFQQVKQTQASLARLCRVHNQLQQANQSSQSQANEQSHNFTSNKDQSASSSTHLSSSSSSTTQQKSTSFVDCLIRRFKNCFSGDQCTVPMFIVGNLSPGSDGTHLILPPCVSLCGQNINRFASPKNLRFMNSIRESCRSIEELDLAGNKLNDLIEVYKILQCAPNLRFLNLSENDLSRTSPVAMANTTATTNCPSTTIYSPLQVNNSQTTLNYNYSAVSSGMQSSNQWLNGSSSAINNQRTCLAPINQNHSQSIGCRRHSSLGQTTTSGNGSASSTSARNHHQRTLHRQGGVSRVAEARLLAATAAVAQSKKTSSTVASKLTNTATTSHKRCSNRVASATANDESKTSTNQPIADVASLKSGLMTGKTKRCLAGTTSTMHLARSLSSLSAKDVRGVSSSLGRLSAHRPNLCRTRLDKNAGLSVKGSQTTSIEQQKDRRSSLSSSITAFRYENTEDTKASGASELSNQSLESKFDASGTKLTTSVSSGKLYVEPIVETDDIDMSDAQHHQVTQQQASKQPSTAAVGSSVVATPPINNPSSQATKVGTNTKSNQVSSAYTFGGVMNTGNNQSSNFRRTFRSIKGLALNNTGCQWRVVCSILSRMPNLEELHLSLNNYERIDLDPNEFKHYSLKRLYLCNNPKLTNWEELDKLLTAFPSLEALSIADCNISQIPENLGRSREWRKLCGLNINGWPIKEWPVIERLNQLPSLIDLKCRNLEVLSTIDEPRHHLIARLPKLQRLNGSEIEEREHAEKAFLRFFMTNSHLERPARFHELIQIHGEVGPIDVDVDLSPPSHAHVRVIYLNRNHYRKDNEDDVLMSEDFLIKLMDSVEPNNVVVQNDSGLQENMDIGESSPAISNAKEPLRLFKDEGQEVIAIDVDLRQSVRKFKSTLASLFGLVSQDLIIYYIDHEMVGLMGPEEIKHNQKKLWNYNVQDGDQFIVEER